MMFLGVLSILPAPLDGCLICFLVLFAAAYRNLGQNLWGPHRYGCLSGVRVRTVVSGSCAAHSLLITTEGKLWSWGKRWAHLPPPDPGGDVLHLLRHRYLQPPSPLSNPQLVLPVPYEHIAFLHFSAIFWSVHTPSFFALFFFEED